MNATNIEIIEATEELLALFAYEVDRVLKPWMENKEAELILAKARYDKLKNEVLREK